MHRHIRGESEENIFSFQSNKHARHFCRTEFSKSVRSHRGHVEMSLGDSHPAAEQEEAKQMTVEMLSFGGGPNVAAFPAPRYGVSTL